MVVEMNPVTHRRVARALRAGGPEVIEVGIEDLAPLREAAELVGTRWWTPNAHWIALGNWRLPPTPLRSEAPAGRCWSFTLQGNNGICGALVDDNYDLANPEECAKPHGRDTHVSLVRSDPPVAVPALRNNKAHYH